jgi:hypothetical protein
VKPQSARNEFLRYVKAAGFSLKLLSQFEGIRLMLDFYQRVRADGCKIHKNGDMLLYQWGIYSWSGRPKPFELDITRQLILDPGEDEDIFQLSLTFKFKPTELLQQLGMGNRWCHSPRELEKFRKFIYGSSALMAIAQIPPSNVQLEFGIAG